MTRFTTGSSAGTRRSRRATALTVTGLSAMLVLAACGDAGGDGGSSSSASGDCSAPGVTDDSITVSTVSPLTGPSATTFSGFVEAAQARFDALNDEGGIGGRKIKIEKNDDAGDGATQTTAARNAVQSQEAFGILSASRVDTMYDYLAQQGVPVVGYPGQPAYSEDENAFGYSGASQIGHFSTAVVERMQAEGASKVAVFAHNSPAAINAATGFVQAAEAAGLDVVIRSFDVPLGSFDATSLAIQLKEEKADAVYTSTLSDSAISILRAAQQQGVKLPVEFVASVYDPAVSDRISDQIQGVLTAPVAVKPTELTGDAGVTKYVETLAKYAKDVDPSEGFASTGYVSADLFIRGLQEAGDCLSRESFIKGLRGISDYDGAGLLVEPAAFTGGDAANGGTPYGTCSWYVTRQGNAWVPDATSTCGEMISIDK